jgi:Pentapeptide repeats (8 copies)
MKDESPWTLFRLGVSRDLQQGARRLGLSRWALQRPTEVWHTLPLELKAVLLLFGASLLLLLIIKVPQWQAASWEGIADRKDLPKLENDARTTLIQALGGAALLIGLFFTWRSIRATERNLQITQETAAKNLAIAQDGQITERFTRAVEQLGSDKLEVRLGGIYGLERIARDSERDHWPIMEVLTSYIRGRASWPPKGDQPLEGKQEAESNQLRPKLAIDIQAVLTVLGRRNRTFEQEGQWLSLERTDLRRADLQHLHLEWAQLGEAHLEEAIFGQVHLERAGLAGAHLERAWLIAGTHLEGAGLIGAHLKDCWLIAAYLEGADFLDADLEGADFRHAHLKGARHLTIEQLASVKTLYKADLDLPLLEQIQQQYPHLLEEPQDEEEIS